MQNRDKTVVGSYSDLNEALEKVQELKSNGYKKEDIIIYSKTLAKGDVAKEATPIQAFDDDYTNKDSESIWDKIKDNLIFKSYNSKDAEDYESKDILYPYRDDINKGRFVIVTQNFAGEEEVEFETRGAGFLNNQNDKT